MDGKYDYRSFYVVLSKADILDWPDFDPSSMPMYKELVAVGRQLSTQIDQAEKARDSL
jgi:hypothetical protein